MTEAEKYFKEWMTKEGYESDNIPIPELMQSFADEQVKKALDEIEKSLMSDEEIIKICSYNFFGTKSLDLRKKEGITIQRKQTLKVLNNE